MWEKDNSFSLKKDHFSKKMWEDISSYSTKKRWFLQKMLKHISPTPMCYCMFSFKKEKNSILFCQRKKDLISIYLDLWCKNKSQSQRKRKKKNKNLFLFCIISSIPLEKEEKKIKIFLSLALVHPLILVENKRINCSILFDLSCFNPPPTSGYLLTCECYRLSDSILGYKITQVLL